MYAYRKTFKKTKKMGQSTTLSKMKELEWMRTKQSSIWIYYHMDSIPKAKEKKYRERYF